MQLLQPRPPSLLAAPGTHTPSCTRAPQFLSTCSADYVIEFLCTSNLTITPNTTTADVVSDPLMRLLAQLVNLAERCANVGVPPVYKCAGGRMLDLAAVLQLVPIEGNATMAGNASLANSSAVNSSTSMAGSPGTPSSPLPPVSITSELIPGAPPAPPA